MTVKYDLHIHSCLSPCADNSMTPAIIAGMAKLEGLDIIALCDHNSSQNCAAFMRAAEFYEIAALCGMEITTSEDIHVLCLFDKLENALAFHEYVHAHRTQFPNDDEIFGEQLIVSETDAVIGRERNMLISASEIGFNDVFSLVKGHGGAAVPAHIDKTSDSAFAVLGEVPEESNFNTYEIYRRGTAMHDKDTFIRPFIPRRDKPARFLVNSDAHYPEEIGIVGSVLSIPDEDVEASGLAAAVIRYLRNE
jgi:Predicted metal-dependent phosphoesterases (PHP family)